MTENYPEFIAAWDKYMLWCGIVTAAIALVILAFHEIKKMGIKDFKERYDFMTANEIKYLWYFLIVVIVSVVFFCNIALTDWVERKGMVWFAGRFFISICIAVILYQLFDTTVRIWYNGVVEGKLVTLRNRPRISPQGNVMRKLSEQEEDAHLEASQIAEEEDKSGVHSVDYDVWLDEKSGFKKVEKYYSYLHAQECPNCGYITLRVDREEVTTAPTDWMNGELIKHYKCSFCNHRERKTVVIAKTSSNS